MTATTGSGEGPRRRNAAATRQPLVGATADDLIGPLRAVVDSLLVDWGP